MLVFYAQCLRFWEQCLKGIFSRHPWEQNRRQKVFNRGLDIIKIDTTPIIHSVSDFNLGGLSPPKPPWATGLPVNQWRPMFCFMAIVENPASHK